MKTASQAMVNLLKTARQIVRADLLTLTLSDGTVYRYTSADVDLSVNGYQWSHALKFTRDKTSIQSGIQVDQMNINVYPDSNVLMGGIPFLQFVNNGGLDGALVKLEAFLSDSWTDTSIGTVILFDGRIADVTASRTQIQLQAKSWLELLDLQFPRNLYMPGCIHTVFDQGCGLARANFAVNSTASANSTTTAINATLTQADHYFDQGQLQFTSGANAGASRTVKTQAGGVLTLLYPLDHAPATGDAFTLYPGCDGQQGTCSGKFNNLPHFRGYPYIPIAEQAI